QGLETLSLRVQRTVDNTLELAQWLQNHPQVEDVNYPGLPGNKYHELAKKYLRNGFGGGFSFNIKGAKKKGEQFVANVSLSSPLANVGATQTLIIPPSTTPHQRLRDEAQLAAGVAPNQLRLSLGIEHIEYIKADIQQAFDAI